MKKALKKMTAALLIITVFFSLSACSENTQNAAAGSEESKRSYVSIKNNITVEDVPVNPDSDGNSDYSYCVIDGLKDKELQQSINDRIFEVYGEVSDYSSIPKYRGLMLQMQSWQGAEPNDANVYVYDTFSECDVLSVIAGGWFTWCSEDYTEYTYFSKNEYLNFDLKTGKELKIGDVFKDSVDGIEFVNNELKKKITKTDATDEYSMYYYSDDVLLTAGEFTGISEDQKFFFSSNGNQLCIVIDCDTPWAYTDGFSPAYIYIDISEVSAYSGAEASDIYEDESVNYVLCYNESSAEDSVQTSNYYDSYSGREGLYYSDSTDYDRNLTQGQIDYIFSDFGEEDPSLEPFLEIYDSFSNDYSDIAGDISLTVHASRVGNYVNIAKYRYFNIYNTLDYENLYAMDLSQNLVFRQDSDTPMTVADLFNDGVDYLSILEPFDTDDNWSFTLGTEYIYWTSEAGEWTETSFSELGCENLSLF